MVAEGYSDWRPVTSCRDRCWVHYCLSPPLMILLTWLVCLWMTPKLVLSRTMKKVIEDYNDLGELEKWAKERQMKLNSGMKV